jgi:hypothetical protein
VAEPTLSYSRIRRNEIVAIQENAAIHRKVGLSLTHQFIPSKSISGNEGHKIGVRMIQIYMVSLLVVFTSAPALAQRPCSIKGWAEFSQPVQALQVLAASRGREPLNHFCIVGYNESSDRYAWVYWREGNALILWEPNVNDPMYPSLSWSRRYLHLNKDVVNSMAEVGTSTYLVTRAWVNKVLRDCRKMGIVSSCGARVRHCASSLVQDNLAQKHY